MQASNFTISVLGGFSIVLEGVLFCSLHAASLVSVLYSVAFVSDPIGCVAFVEATGCPRM